MAEGASLPRRIGRAAAGSMLSGADHRHRRAGGGSDARRAGIRSRRRRLSERSADAGAAAGASAPLLATAEDAETDVIGRLAGGVAHNFNNLLTVILVSSEMLMAQLPPGSPEWQQAHCRTKPRCGPRSSPASLLAYSGRQLLRPVDIDLNATIRDMNAVLQRVVGERVTLMISPEDGLPPVRIDVNQIQRAILDLATHARDAMPGGGTMIVETAAWS